MKLINPDHDRRIEIPGAGLVRRPVDIDKAKTGFANLRSLRIYCFEAGSTIDGHAEEDEVFVVVLAGSINLTLSDDDAGTNAHPFLLKTPAAAYMPPGSAYRLVAEHEADVAYARATPATGPPYKVFTPSVEAASEGICILLDESTYAVRLSLRLLKMNARQDSLSFTPEANREALLHVRTETPRQTATITASNAETITLNSWDTVAIAPGDQPSLRIAQGSSALVLIVLATNSES